jgi:HK97 family phage prohead protease
MSPNLTEFGPRLVTLATGASGLRETLHCEVREVPGDSTPAVLDFIASDDTLDRYGEVIQLSAWDLSEYIANPVVVDSHDYSSVAKILGRSVELVVDGKSLRNRVEFCLENPMGALSYKMARAGFIRAESVGFIPGAWESGNGKETPFRTYTAAKLVEISLVPVPANPSAVVGLALKAGAIDRPDLRAVIEHLKSLCTSDTEPAPPGRAAGSGVDAAHEALARAIENLHRLVRS